jgi:hypothetical protein
LPPGTTPQVPNTVIASSVWNAALDDIASTLNVPWPVAIGLGAAGATGSWDSINIAGADIASSGTINLTTATGPNLTITGTTTITTVTLASGNVRFARANAAFQLTASANLIINGSASTNYTTTAGDLLIFIGGAGSVTRVWAISGSVAAASNAEVIAGTIANKYVSPATAYFPTGFVYGLTLTTDATDATNDIVIAVGGARSDDDTANLVQTASLIKRADANWAVGTNQGMLDTGAVGNSRYALWSIKRPDTNVVDVLSSTSFTAPTMPANYTVKALIGEFTRAGGVNGTPIWYGPRVSAAGYSVSRLGMPVATTSGTTHDFTAPGPVKGVSISLAGVSTNGTSMLLVQIGDAGGIEATGYLGTSSQMDSSVASTAFTTGFGIRVQAASGVMHGTMKLSLENAAAFTWVASGVFARSELAVTVVSSGSKSLSATLETVRLTTVNGTDAFDAGSVNVIWEY